MEQLDSAFDNQVMKAADSIFYGVKEHRLNFESAVSSTRASGAFKASVMIEATKLARKWI